MRAIEKFKPSRTAVGTTHEDVFSSFAHTFSFDKKILSYDEHVNEQTTPVPSTKAMPPNKRRVVEETAEDVKKKPKNRVARTHNSEDRVNVGSTRQCTVESNGNSCW